MTKYIAVEWPEYQTFMEHPRFREECYYCADANTYFIPEDLYNEVIHKLEFPKKYENTNLGTIVCYETHAIVNGEQSFWYDMSDLKKGNKVLVYNHNTNEWIITTCTACNSAMPILVENKDCIIGINSELIGHYNPETPF